MRLELAYVENEELKAIEVTKGMLLTSLLINTKNFPDTIEVGIFNDPIEYTKIIDQRIKDIREEISKTDAETQAKLLKEEENLKKLQKEAKDFNERSWILGGIGVIGATAALIAVPVVGWFVGGFILANMGLTGGLAIAYKDKLAKTNLKIYESQQAIKNYNNQLVGFQLGINSYFRHKGYSDIIVERNRTFRERLESENNYKDLNSLLSDLISTLNFDEELSASLSTLTSFELLTLLFLLHQNMISRREVEEYLNIENFLGRRNYLLSLLMVEVNQVFDNIFNIPNLGEVDLINRVEKTLNDISDIKISDTPGELFSTTIKGLQRVNTDSVFSKVDDLEETYDSIVNGYNHVLTYDVLSNLSLLDDELLIGNVIDKLAFDKEVQVDMDRIKSLKLTGESKIINEAEVLTEVLNRGFIQYLEDKIIDVEVLKDSIKGIIDDNADTESLVYKLVNEIYPYTSEEDVNTGEFITHNDPTIQSLLRSFYTRIFPKIGDVKPSDPSYIKHYLMNLNSGESFLQSNKYILKLEKLLSFYIDIKDEKIVNINMSEDSKNIMKLVSSIVNVLGDKISLNADQSLFVILVEIVQMLNKDLTGIEVDNDIMKELRLPVVVDIMKNYVHTLTDFANGYQAVEENRVYDDDEDFYYRVDFDGYHPVIINTKDGFELESGVTYYKSVPFRYVIQEDFMYHSDIEYFEFPFDAKTGSLAKNIKYLDTSTSPYSLNDKIKIYKGDGSDLILHEVYDVGYGYKLLSSGTTTDGKYTTDKVYFTEDRTIVPISNEDIKTDDVIYRLNNYPEYHFIKMTRIMSGDEYPGVYEESVDNPGIISGILDDIVALKNTDYYIKIKDGNETLGFKYVKTDRYKPGELITGLSNISLYNSGTEEYDVLTKGQRDQTISELGGILYEKVHKYRKLIENEILSEISTLTEITTPSKKYSFTSDSGTIEVKDIYFVEDSGIILPFNTTRDVAGSGTGYFSKGFNFYDRMLDYTGTKYSIVEGWANLYDLNAVKASGMDIFIKEPIWIPLVVNSERSSDLDLIDKVFVKDKTKQLDEKDPILISPNISKFYTLFKNYREMLFNFHDYIEGMRKTTEFKQLMLSLEFGGSV